MSLSVAELAYMSTLSHLTLSAQAIAYRALSADVPVTAVHMDACESVTGGALEALEANPS